MRLLPFFLSQTLPLLTRFHIKPCPSLSAVLGDSESRRALVERRRNHGWHCERCRVKGRAGRRGSPWCSCYPPLLGLLVWSIQADGSSLLTSVHRLPSRCFLKGSSSLPLSPFISVFTLLFLFNLFLDLLCSTLVISWNHRSSLGFSFP